MAENRAAEFLGCKVGGIPLAFAVDSVQEILETHLITRLPGCPGFVLGMVNLRGSVVPVLDLWKAAEEGIASAKKIVILKSSEGLVGLLIGELDDLVHFDSYEKVSKIPDPLQAFAASLMGEGVGGSRYFVMNAESLISNTIAAKER